MLSRTFPALFTLTQQDGTVIRDTAKAMLERMKKDGDTLEEVKNVRIGIEDADFFNAGSARVLPNVASRGEKAEDEAELMNS